MHHDHDWHVISRNAQAFFSKRDDGTTRDEFWATGTAQRCSGCPALFFVPDDPHLSAVEIEPLEDEGRAA